MKIQRKPDATQAEPMTRHELRRRMDAAGLNAEQLGRRLGLSERQVNYLLSGVTRIKYLIAYAVRHL